MDGAPVAPALAVDEQGTLPWARHYAQPTLHLQEGLVCWPGPHALALPGQGQRGAGGVLWPSCSARGSGRQNPDSSPREPGPGGLDTAVSLPPPGPDPGFLPPPGPDPGFLCGSGTGPLSLGPFPISHPDWVPRAPGPDMV